MSTSYSSIHKDRVYLASIGFKRWYEALDDIGYLFRAYRNPNFDDSIPVERNEPITNSVFGYPVKNEKILLQNNNELDRRASPFITTAFFINESNEHQFTWICIQLSDQFYSTGISVNKRGRTINIDTDVFENFIPWLKQNV